METFEENMTEFKKQLEKGAIQKAYKGLLEYLMYLRTYFKKKYPDYIVSGSIYNGFMDMTFFSFSPKSLKSRDLKIVIVFIYNTFRFEVWLSGNNKQVQQKYWELFRESDWDTYHIVTTIKDVDSIIEYNLLENMDLSDLDTLTEEIEKGTLRFIEDIESFLSKQYVKI